MGGDGGVNTVGQVDEAVVFGTGDDAGMDRGSVMKPAVIAPVECQEPAGPPSALNQAQPAVGEDGPSLRVILQPLNVASDVYEEALLYGLERGWSCAGLLQQSRRERAAER